MERLEAFYDSDEDVSWGPLTLREIKRRLRTQPDLIPNRRHTTNYAANNSYETSPEISKIEQKTDDSIPQISEYLIVSEETNAEVNTTNTTEYLTVNDKSSVYFSTNDLERSDPVSKPPADESYFNFVQRAMNTTAIDIENQYQTLVDISVNSCGESFSSSFSSSKYDPIILISSEEENELPKNVGNTEKLNSTLQHMDSDIILLSDEDELEFPNHHIKNEKLSDVKEVSNEQSCSYEFENSIEKNYDHSSCSKDYDDDSNFKTDIAGHLNDSLPSRSTSPRISIPSIDLHQFNDTNESIFNNTLDRINALLEQANNLSLTENINDTTKNEKIIETSERKTKVSILQNEAPCTNVESIIPEGAVEIPIKMPVSQNKFKSSNLAHSIKTDIPIMKNSPVKFRVPEMPDKLKVSNKSKLNLNNIVSPVRMYIKHSPNPILKQNIHAMGKPKIKMSPSYVKPKNKENQFEIPNGVVYKPSKKKILTTEEPIQFPGSLDKMIKKATITKHEWCPISKKKLIMNESLNPEANLTQSFMNDSETNENVSILHTKNALK